VEIVRCAIQVPARQIAANAGEDRSLIVGCPLEKDEYWLGLLRGEQRETGSGVGRRRRSGHASALQDAASVASLLITTRTLVADKAKPKNKARRSSFRVLGRMSVGRGAAPRPPVQDDMPCLR
jgi:chaperonin GroEL